MVLLLDVLEELQDPERLLLEMRNRSRALRPGSEAPLVVVVTPNVAFITNRLALLFGRFNYADRVVEFRVGPQKFRDTDELRKRLKKLHEAEPERPATLKPLPGTVYADVVVALDAAIQAKFEEITFAGSFGKKKK